MKANVDAASTWTTSKSTSNSNTLLNLPLRLCRLPVNSSYLSSLYSARILLHVVMQTRNRRNATRGTARECQATTTHRAASAGLGTDQHSPRHRRYAAAAAASAGLGRRLISMATVRPKHRSVKRRRGRMALSNTNGRRINETARVVVGNLHHHPIAAR